MELLFVVLPEGGPMTDADHDAIRQFGAQQLIERKFQPHIQRRGGLVKEDRLRFGEQDARKGDTLLLTGESTLAQSCSSSSRLVSGASATLVNTSRS